MNELMVLAANTIILYGGPNGIYSPSHPHIYPPPMSPVVEVPSVVVEQPYIPEYTLTDEHGTPLIR